MTEIKERIRNCTHYSDSYEHGHHLYRLYVLWSAEELRRRWQIPR